ncbi:MAG: methyl-accepting chemotaxis protein, partial [Sphingomonas sp.]
TQQNAAMVEEATAAARSLSAEADELARQVARFKIGQGEAPKPASPVHQLQNRAADAGRRIARSARRVAGGGGAALAASDDWSEF